MLKLHKKISSVTLLLDTLQRSESKVDIHMCGSCKDVVIAYKYAPELFEKKCDCIYLNAGTYEIQDPLEYNVSLEPYAFSQIFKIPCNIRWAPCFDRLVYPLSPAIRANYYKINQADMVPVMSEALKKYFNFMYGPVMDKGWLSYLREELDTELLATWENTARQMWSTPGYLLSADKKATLQGEIVDISDPSEAVFVYTPVNVKVTDGGIVEWEDTSESNVTMFRNAGIETYLSAMGKVIKNLLSTLPDM